MEPKTSVVHATTKSLRTTADGGLTVSFEIAPEHVQDAFLLFGTTGTNVGIAPITADAAQRATQRAAAKPAAERQSFTQMTRTKQAVMRCKEPDFWAFLSERIPFDITNEDDAASAVRVICGVSSRAFLDNDGTSQASWDELEAAYYASQHGRR